MTRLLKIEWLKIKNYTAFKVFAIFFSVGVVVTNYIVFIFNKNIINQVNSAGLVSAFNPYTFENTWQTTSYTTGWLLILPAMLLIILITNEYTFRTGRQNIIDGWSRAEFISVKLMMALIIAFISTVLVIVTGAGFGFASGTSFSTNSFSHVGYFFLKALTYNMLAVLISVLVKKTGFAIGLYFIYMSAENLLSQFLYVWSIKLKYDYKKDPGDMGDYLPMNAADGLLTFPDNPLKSLAKSKLPTDYYWIVLACAIIYLLFFILWSRRKFIKADL
jgi:ABC-2 type transport system permease protein